MLRIIVTAALVVGCAAAETTIPKTAVEVEPGFVLDVGTDLVIEVVGMTAEPVHATLH